MVVLVAEMSSGTTMTTQAAQNVKSEQLGSAQERTMSSLRRTRDLPTLDVNGGLGITAPSQACIRRERSPAPDGAPRSPLLEIGDGSDLSSPDYDYMLSKEYFRNQRLQQSQDRIAQLRKSYAASQSISEASAEDVSSSASSSFRNQRCSSDSWATRASTLPTTPGTRSSITSTFSRAFSRTSRPASSSSTPTHSRSPSPPPKGTTSSYVEIEINGAAITTTSSIARDITPASKRKEPSKRSQDNASEKSQSSDDQSDALRKSRNLRKTHSTGSAGLLKSSISENEAPDRVKPPRPDVPPIPTSFSTSRLSTLGSPGLPSDRPSTPSKLLSAQRLSSTIGVTPKKKDELWNAFRNLDADYAKFASKSIAFKASAVRTLLMPFLRNYEKHPSNLNLRAEDLDRRANILNKWWTGLIELLHGSNNQSMSGTDRPAVLDGISGIMDRAEWRSSPSPFCPLERRSHNLVPQRHNSDDSVVAGSSNFLADSVHHNVRNIFIQNLTAQMDFVVGKMSLRNASASLVAFCGKTCAFAFFFVPNMADTLVRLWDLQIDTPRRVLQTHSVGKFEDLSSIAIPITSDFPPSVQDLALSSLPKYMRKLRTPCQPPVGTNDIQWRGPWLERWKGGDSDLFYVFVKHFHILASDFLAPNITKKERLCAPGMLMVHAQMLVNLDATIHRQSSQDSKETVGVGPATTFDTILVDPDAVANTLPMPPASNATRSMGENRLVMLIRDFISERPIDHPVARQIFAESIGDILQAAACRCGLFDHAAAYTLLDFMEEVLVPLTRYERLQGCQGVVIHFEFWKTVFKKMIISQNTMTEIRLYAFLYTIWDTVICESNWKAEVCLELLLEKSLFEGRFNHWCPTVRAYYMRLLCWRLARQDGEYSELDLKLLELFLERLRTTWSYYLYLKEHANAQKGFPRPGTNPCNPVPSRRLRIVRMDRPVNDSARQWLRVDCPMPKGSIKSTSTALERNSVVPQVDLDARPGSSVSTNSDEEAEQRGRGLGGFLRNLMGTKSRSTSRNPSKSTPTDSGIEMESRNSIVRPSTDTLQPQRLAPSPLSTPPNGTTPPDSIQRRQFSFKFALEYFPNAKPLPPMRLSSPRLPYPAQQYLLSYSQKERTPGIVQPAQPTGESKCHAKYSGHALAEWTVILNECQSFFERRKHEGIPSNRYVETPTLGVEVFRRPG